jgi:hypothetical protein
MSEPDKSEIPPAYTALIRLDPKGRKPSVAPGLPDGFTFLLGQIGALWSMYQAPFEILLQAILDETSDPDHAKWRVFSYEQKEEAFRRAATKVLASHIALLTYLERILDDARDLQLDRNLLLHGTLQIRVDTKEDARVPPDVTIVATGRRKKREITREFSQADMEEMYFGLCHAAGRINSMLHPTDVSLQQFALQDIDFWRDFLRSHRLIAAT